MNTDTSTDATGRIYLAATESMARPISDGAHEHRDGLDDIAMVMSHATPVLGHVLGKDIAAQILGQLRATLRAISLAPLPSPNADAYAYATAIRAILGSGGQWLQPADAIPAAYAEKKIAPALGAMVEWLREYESGRVL